MGFGGFLKKVGNVLSAPTRYVGKNILPGLLGGLGSFLGARIQDQRAEDQMAAQEEFAKMGIRWRVEDARAAGINPLVALGANLSMPSPVAVGDYQSALAEMGRTMGQDISRAVHQTRTQRERSEVLANLTLEHHQLQNDLLRSQIMRMNREVGPALPSSSDMPLLTGQGDTRVGTTGGLVVEQPMMRTHSSPGRPAQEVGAVPDYSYVRTDRGIAIVPSMDVKQRIEDMIIPEMMWSLRNTHLPFSGEPPLPDERYYPLPKGMGYKRWRWDPWTQEFYPSRIGTGAETWKSRAKMAVRGLLLRKMKLRR